VTWPEAVFYSSLIGCGTLVVLAILVAIIAVYAGHVENRRKASR